MTRRPANTATRPPVSERAQPAAGGSATGQVEWPRVGVFYAIAFGGASLVAAALWWVGQRAGAAAGPITQVALALLYMPLPLVAGLIVERRAGRTPLLAAERAALRGRFWRAYGRNAGVAVGVMLLVLALGFVVAWAAGALGVPGAGRLVTTDEGLLQRLRELYPALPAGVPLPGVPVVAGSGIVQGLIAGVTINGVFAFGEEYGWRGVLADELRPLGRVRANLLTGVLWGLWHAPIILLGHNYGAEWAWGIPLMAAWTIPLSFILSWTREATGSVLAPSFLHGAYNGTIGLFVLLVAGGNVLIALPMGLLIVPVLALVAVALWAWRSGPGSPD